jgi:hypothetical protein
MLPKMLIRAGSRLIMRRPSWPYDGWRKNVDKDGAGLPQHFGLHDPCARERLRGWTSIILHSIADGSGGKSSAHRVHAGERDKTHPKKMARHHFCIDESPAMSRSLPSKRGTLKSSRTLLIAGWFSTISLFSCIFQF